MIATRFSSFGAYEGMNGFAIPADCADILVNSMQFDNLSRSVLKHELGENGDADAAALLTMTTTAEVDASVATTIAVVTRSGWLLFYWESLVCLAVADLYQAIVVAAAKVTNLLCYASFAC